MNNYHFYYVAILIVFGIGVMAATTMDYDDKGECKYTGSPENPKVVVRQPGSNTFVESEFCILINS